jgi:transposase
VEETSELSELVERVAALDLGKAVLTACVRVPHADKPGRRCQEVREYRTTTTSLLALAGDLRGHGVTLVAMEATSDYWKPVFYLLEAEGFTCWLLNARHVKNVPGRPKTGQAGRNMAGEGRGAGDVLAEPGAAPRYPPAA